MVIGACFSFQERIYTPAGGRTAAAWARPTSGSSMVVQASAVFQAVDGPTHQLAAQSEGVCHTPHPPYNLFSSFFTGANFNELMVISLHSNKFRMNTDPKEIILSDVIEPSGFHLISDRSPLRYLQIYLDSINGFFTWPNATVSQYSLQITTS